MLNRRASNQSIRFPVPESIKYPTDRNRPNEQKLGISIRAIRVIRGFHIGVSGRSGIAPERKTQP